MRIIITENQLHNLIPISVKRRIDDGDLELIDNLIKQKYGQGRSYWNFSSDFDTYLSYIIADSINDLVYFHKDYGIMDNDPNWSDRRNVYSKVFQGLMPYLKHKYKDEIYKTWSKGWK
jgi:hypothetical protein